MKTKWVVFTLFWSLTALFPVAVADHVHPPPPQTPVSTTPPRTPSVHPGRTAACSGLSVRAGCCGRVAQYSLFFSFPAKSPHFGAAVTDTFKIVRN
ncbi:hypothetical protein DFJ73DRAFT_233288 [Zopfochytrium polystomum]|nr:hypothetical protein DFJ73DRAFT_233288 [Zopfochytrium polystomum]